VLYLLSDMGAGESSGLLAIDPLLVGHREDVYVLNEAQGAPEYLSYSTGEHHRPSDLGGKQGELFEKILGYRVDQTRMSQMGDELASSAKEAASLDLKDGEKRLGDYRIVREVGRGAMGAVFEAFQESLGRRVALKVLPGSFALEPRRLERFRREARATARIHHPSIVPVYEVGESGGTHYYSMEFVDGASLEDLLARARKEAEAETKKAWRKSSSTSDPTAVARTVERLASLAEGLEEAHRLGLIHRDVKPSNILVEGASSVSGLPSMPLAGDAGRCVLVDFGLVHDVEAQTLTRSGEMVGTLGYMSPEQVSKGDVDARADVYSLGATLYEVLTLRTPFDGKSDHEIHRAILFEEPPPPRRHNPRLHRDLETIVLKCMEKNPERRYASAGALAKDLRRFLRYEPIDARPRSALSRLGNRAWKHRRSLGVTGVTAILLLSALFFAILSRNEARLRREAEYGPRVLAALMKIEQADLNQASWNIWTNTRQAQEAETSILGGLRQVLADAIAALGNEIASVPERPEAHYHRARAYRVANRDDDALGDLARVTAIDPEFVPALVLEAEIRGKRGEEEASAALRERARAAGKRGWKEKWIQAQEALENGLWGDAERAFGEIIALEAEGGEAYLGASYLTRLGRGKARLEAKDYLRAIDDFAVVDAGLRGARVAVLLEGKAYHLLGLKREAAALFERVHAEAPPAQKDEVALAISQIFAWREPETALEWCAKVKVDFRREQASVLILWIAGRSEDAVQAGERAIALNPAYAPSYADLSWVLTNLRRFTEAIQCARKAIELRPKDAFMRLYALPYALRSSERNVEALAAYEETLRLDPTMAAVHTFMAYTLMDLGDSKLAEEHRQRAKKLQPLEPHGLFSRAAFLSSEGKEEDALAEYDRAIRVDPAWGDLHDKKGVILERLGKLEEATTEYQKATACFPEASGHLNLGRLLEGQGKFDDALAGYVKMLERLAGAPNWNAHLAAQRLLGRKDVSLAAAGLQSLIAVLEAALPFEGDYPELLRTLALARSRLSGTSDIAKAIEPIRAALARKGGKDPALSLVLGEALLLDARPGEALAVLEAAARHPHATVSIAKTAGECRKALLPGLATPASVEEALLAREQEVLVPEDAVWRYFPGMQEPSEGLHWTGPGFDDGSWKEGKSGFGYEDGDDATVLEDMERGYSTLYIRRKLTVPDPGRYERIILSLRVDDGAA
jgi:serine/threonine protein kinase/Flp pilus assembly protein TadD